MTIKTVVVLLLGLAFASFHLAEAQQPKKVPRIGFLSGGGDPVETEAFRQGLRELGYIEGKTIVIENRYIQGTVNSIPSVVAGLVQLKVDVLVLGPIGAIRAAKQATKTIPIVMVITVDPVATGIVDSFARPGGNITGLATLNRELGGKRLELFKEMAPTISRIGVLADADGEASAIGFRAYEAAASVLNVQLQSLEVRGPNPDLEGAFQVATKGRANALITIGNPLINSYRKRIIDLAIRNRLPSLHERREWVETGGLMSYSADYTEHYRRAATYVDKILKGTKPADLPIEQPMKFELVVNLKTAKQIGLTIPPNVLARADKVIR